LNFSPNLVAYASLHANGSLSVHPMKADPASPLIAPLIAQKFTNIIKKGGGFDDLYLLSEQYLTEGPLIVPLKYQSDVVEMAMKVILQTMKFSNVRVETSKEFTIEQAVSPPHWGKLVSLQYNFYSRLERGARIAGNGIVLIQLRTMFMAFMMSCKLETQARPGASAIPKPQIMARVWISLFQSIRITNL